jgi:hypothetical protein
LRIKNGTLIYIARRFIKIWRRFARGGTTAVIKSRQMRKYNLDSEGWYFLMNRVDIDRKLKRCVCEIFQND